MIPQSCSYTLEALGPLTPAAPPPQPALGRSVTLSPPPPPTPPRASPFQVKSFPYLGRIKGMVSRVEYKVFQLGMPRESKEINIEGRVQFDMMQV